MTPDHCLSHGPLQGIEVRPQQVIPLGVNALAERMGVSRATAYRLLERTLARQHDPAVLRVVRLPVPIGSGARRAALHILWPLTQHLDRAQD